MLTKLKSLLLLSLLWLTVTGQCPYQNCDCVEGYIICQNFQWTTLPKLLISYVPELPLLNLDGNLITTIPVAALPTHLAGISLQGNPITTIDDTALDGSADTLSSLVFSGARFTEIPTVLLHLNVLRTLQISNTTIQTWNADIFKHIGSTLTSLTLDDVGLKSWPTWIQYLPYLNSLELSNASFVLPGDSLNNQAINLTSLVLCNDTLTEIPTAVSVLASLTTLQLDNNRISRLDALPRFGTLTTLSAQNNTISNAKLLSDDLRPFADSLSMLQLQGNHLTAFPELSFMQKLQNVYLSNNPISDLTTGSVPPPMMYLEMVNCNVSSLAGFLSTGIKLNVLRFASNSIKEIKAIDYSYTVSDLDVASNLITELTDNSFPTGSRMQALYLDNNPLSTITEESFRNLALLTYLSVRNTKLTRLSLSFRYLDILDNLDLRNSTELVCTCVEQELREWAETREDLTIFGDCDAISIHDFLYNLSPACPTPSPQSVRSQSLQSTIRIPYLK